MNVLCMSILMLAMTSEDINASDFTKLMKGLHGRIQDLSFVYEGDVHYPGANTKASQDLDENFQGRYFFRSDDSVLLDAFHRKIGREAPPVNHIRALYKGMIDHSARMADLKKITNQTKSGHSQSLTGPSYPHGFLYTWYFLRLGDPGSCGYRFLGWEVVDGHRCLNVRLDWICGLGGDDDAAYYFWIDIERGGHPLRVEIRKKNAVVMRLSEVKLRRFTAQDESYWLPVAALRQTFPVEGGFLASPVSRETYSIVDGSVLINQGLKDEVFTVRWAVDSQGSSRESNALRIAREEFEKTPLMTPFRSDPKGVQERLDRALDLANQQSKQLDASAGAQEEGRSWILVPYVIGIISLCLLISSFFWFWRHR